MKIRTLPWLAVLAFAFSALGKDAAPAPVIVPVKPAADQKLIVTPDRADWTHELGTDATFKITIDQSPYPADGIPIKYRLGPEMMEGAETSATVPADGLVLKVPSPKEPGFVRCIVTATLDGEEARGIATIGFSPDKIGITQTEPADFDAFWAKKKAELAKVPMEPEVTPAPDLSTPKVDVSYVSFQNVGGWAGPSRFYGVLCVPRGPGPFPALLNVPGAGVRPYSGLRSLAGKGVITLQVGIHGIPVNGPKEIYDQLYRGALANYNRFNLDNRDAYYYARVYLGCVRACDYLMSLPKWDKENLVVMGGSQGGQLSIVTAALVPEVTALAPSFPAYSDVTGYLHGRAGGWPGLFRPDRNGKPGDAPIEAKIETTGYYDTVNFARRLKVPGVYFWGYNDETCPPTSTFAAYNVITAPKQLWIKADQGHRMPGDQQNRVDEWIVEQTGASPVP